MKVLSLFDGISAAQVALANLHIPVEYTAIEIDTKWSNKVTDYHFPKTKRPVNDIREFHPTQKYDLVIGGSPCQDFSSLTSGSTRMSGLNGTKSSLFFEYVRVLEEVQQINPDVLFLLENVKMKKTDRDFISQILGVEPVEINSRLFVVQNRGRYYWTNINYNLTSLPQKLKKTLFSVYAFYYKKEAHYDHYPIAHTKYLDVSFKGAGVPYVKDKLGNKRLLASTRLLEYLQGFPVDYVNRFGFSKTRNGVLLGNSFTVPVIEWFLEQIGG